MFQHIIHIGFCPWWPLLAFQALNDGLGQVLWFPFWRYITRMIIGEEQAILKITACFLWLLSRFFAMFFSWQGYKTHHFVKNTAGLCTIGSSSTVEMNFATPLVSGCRAKAGKGVLIEWPWVSSFLYPHKGTCFSICFCWFERVTILLGKNFALFGGTFQNSTAILLNKRSLKTNYDLTYCPHLFAFSLFVYFLFEVGGLQVQVYSPNPRKQPLRIHRQSTNHSWKLDTAVSRVSY